LNVRALFDVNMLLALFDPGHIHHEAARAWWLTHRSEGWASCPLTQNGFARIISKPGYQRPVALPTAVSMLRAQLSQSDHEFWPDAISIADDQLFDQSFILGPHQITDVYLLGLAVKHGGRLVTLDRGLPLRAVRGAEARHLIVL
jgi:toxin-antitoxin system PIN domain toxin